MSSDIYKTESFIASIIPDAELRRLCLSLFLESLTEANIQGTNKWGVYYRNDALRLLVGSLIVFTIDNKGLWIALDQQSLQKSKEELDLLNLSKNWEWDKGRWSEYTLIPSKNGYYMPSEKHLQIWPIIRRLHFAYIYKAAKKFAQLRKDSQQRHMPQMLEYLRDALKKYVPEPVYGDSADLVSNPIQEVQEYQSTRQYHNLPETERESIIQSRIGQGRFRMELIHYWNACTVTDCKIIEILRASHIKPWRDSTNEERLDVYNGLLLVPNLDIAFDKGLISFADNGKIMITDLLPENERVKLGINTYMRIARLDNQHYNYLKYHRNNVYNNNLLKH